MSLKRNIPLIYIIGSLMWGRFFIPVLALFYIASQVPIEQFAIIMSVFALSTLVLEIPSGVIADILGRKKTLLMSRGIYILEIILIAFFNGFWPFLIAKIISGIGVSLSSGTNSALVYETLKKLKKEKYHKKISGNLFTITNISMAFVFIVGAFLFKIYYKLPAYASLPLITMGFILTLFIEEPYPNKHKLSFKKAKNHLIEGCKYFKNHKSIIAITLFSVPIATIISITLSISSAYLETIKIPIVLIGIIAFIGSLLAAFSSKRAHIFEEKLGEKKSFYLIQVVVILSTFLMIFLIPYFGVIFYLLIPLISGFFAVLINNYMNTKVYSTHRATMLSIRNMADNLGIFILFPIFGFITKNISMVYSYSMLLIVLILGFIVFQSYIIKKNVLLNGQ